MKGAPVCEWLYDIDDFWETACGHAYQFFDGGPRENKHTYCCYCGRRLKARVIGRVLERPEHYIRRARLLRRRRS